MKLWHWLALGIGAYFAFALSSFPAGTAYAWFAPAGLQLQGLEGTLWSGRAATANVGQLSLHDVRWSVHAWQLLLGRVAADLRGQLDEGFVSAHVKATRGRVSLSEVRASTSLATLRAVLPVGGLRGETNVTLSALDLDVAKAWPTKVVGDLKLLQLETTPFSLAGPRGKLVPIGNYSVRLAEGKGPINATFNDTGGPLEVSGTLAVNAARAYQLDALIKPRADAAQEIVDGLNAMATGEPDAEGRRRLMLSGSL
jgi:general secretion pathway protein N